MKLISETPTHLFYAIVVPMETRHVFKSPDSVNGVDFIVYKDIDGDYESVADFLFSKKVEIIGIQGGGESLTTEQVSEMFPSMSSYRRRLKELGLETENPYKKPLRDDYLVSGTLSKPSFKEWQEELKKWEQAEKSLVKVIIIKSEK